MIEKDITDAYVDVDVHSTTYKGEDIIRMLDACEIMHIHGKLMTSTL